MIENRKRESWIDIAKGILIIFVVMGHVIPGHPHWKLEYISDYVYLFHMPAFFMISGLFFKQLTFKEFLTKRIKSLIIPYLSCIVVYSIYRYTVLIIKDNITVIEFIKDVIKNIYGGYYLQGSIGAMWFITCLFFVEALWQIINKYVSSNIIKILIVALLYLLAHMQAWYCPNINLPWSVDIGFYVISFYCFGYFIKSYILNKHVFACNFILSSVLLVLIYLKVLNYGLELWGHTYTNLLLDFIVPVSISITFFNLCYYIAKVKGASIFEKLGKITLPIMCMQGTTLHILNGYMKNNFWLFTIIATIIPALITVFILEKNNILSKLFLGKN